MRHLLITFALIFTCISSHASKDGGGGNIIENEQVSFKDMSRFLSKSKSLVIAWLNFQQLNMENNFYVSYGDRDTEKAIQSLIANRKINPSLEDNLRFELLVDSGCYVAGEGYKDAGVVQEYQDGKYPICISYERLSKKLNKVNFRKQLFALIIHEMSHWAGLGELDAQLIQKYVYDSVLGIDLEKIAKISSLQIYIYSRTGDAVNHLLMNGTYSKSKAQSEAYRISNNMSENYIKKAPFNFIPVGVSKVILDYRDRDKMISTLGAYAELLEIYNTTRAHYYEVNHPEPTKWLNKMLLNNNKKGEL